MVVGNGMIAKKFEHYKHNGEILIFASGVSNSRENAVAAFDRETNLLRQTVLENSDKLLVYFSTCSMYDPEEMHTHYVKHKLNIEQWIKESGIAYLICRASNVVGGSYNQYTIFNYFMQHIKTQTTLNLWKHAYRNIIDVDDVVTIVDYLVRQPLFRNQTINTANPNSFSVLEIIKEIELFLHKQAVYTTIERGHYFKIPVPHIEELKPFLKLVFDSNYIRKVLEKHY